MTPMKRRGFLAFGSLAAGSLAAPRVLRAQSLRTVADTLAGDNRFSTLLDIITRISMVEDFRAAEPMTLFAPVNQAFTGAPATILADVLGGAQTGSQASAGATERQRYVALINYHVVPGMFRVADLQGSDRRLRTRNGSDLQISATGNTLQLRNPAPSQQLAGFNAPTAHLPTGPAEVIGPETVASNGVIYPINQVLFP